MIQRLYNQKGVSLLEGVLGILIVSVGFLGLLPLMTNATAKTMNNDSYVVATYLANQEVENINADKKFYGYLSISNANSRYANKSYTGVNSAYSNSYVITEVRQSDMSTPQAGSGYKKIDVTVKWSNNPNDKVVLTTVVTNY